MIKFIGVFMLLCLSGPIMAELNSVVFLQPATDTKNYCYASWIRMVCADNEIAQDFTLKLDPPVAYEYFAAYNSAVWFLKKELKPKTTYKATLSSPTPFLFHGQKVQQITWSFKTADAKTLKDHKKYIVFHPTMRESADDPSYFDTYDNGHFKLELIEIADPNNTTKYDIAITLYATYNAGVNGPPLEEQWAEYKRQLRQYKNEALNWLRQKSYDPASLRIKWMPSEAGKI